jgi:hypothetical protein
MPAAQSSTPADRQILAVGILSRTAAGRTITTVRTAAGTTGTVTALVPSQQTLDSAGSVYVTAAQQAHEEHCADCRDRATEAAALRAENGRSMARRDRVQLDLHLPTGGAR